MTEINTELKDALKEKIYSFIDSSAHVTFAELMRIEGFRGDYEYGIAGKYNIVWWSSMSSEAIQAMEELKNEKRIVAGVAHVLCYLADGEILNLPVKGNNRANKKPQWVPLHFCSERFADKTKKIREK